VRGATRQAWCFAAGLLVLTFVLAGGLAGLRILLPPPTVRLADRPPPLLIPAAYPAKFKPRHILIDVGHGGKDTGAKSRWSAPEKDVNLRVAKALGRHLRATGKYRVSFTRQTDAAVSISARRRMSNARRPDAFLSIHSDWAYEFYKHGTWMIWSSRQQKGVGEKSARLAAYLGAGLKTERLPLYNWGPERRHLHAMGGTSNYLCAWPEYSSYVTDARRLGVLDKNQRPAVLIETHFLSNPLSVAFFQTDETIGRFCEGVEAGLRGFFLAKEPSAGGK